MRGSSSMNENNSTNEKRNEEGQVPLFVSEERIENMKVVHVGVPPESIDLILSSYRLTKEQQQASINEMAEKDPEAFLNMSEKDSQNEILLRLMQETVNHFLNDTGIISNCDMYESGFKEDSSMKIDAYYIDKSEMANSLKPNKSTKEGIHSTSKVLAPIINLDEYKKKKGLK